jgi:excisionase family DNA binding protein
MTARRDHYAVLGVPSTATASQIKAAFRRLAREHHPDVTAGDARSAREFPRIARAWEVLGDPKRRRAYDERHQRGRFAGPGTGGPQAIVLEPTGPVYHLDLGHHSDFYQAGDPLSVAEAAVLVGRDPGLLRRAIREGRLPATRDGRAYLLRRRDVERLDRTIARRRPRPGTEPHADDAPAADELATAEA